MGYKYRQGICFCDGSQGVLSPGACDSSFGFSTEFFSSLALWPLVLLKLAGENWKISWLYKARIEITYPVVTVVYSRSFKFVLQ